MKIISFILLSAYFLFKLLAGAYVILKYKSDKMKGIINKINTGLNANFSKKNYYIALTENAFFLGLVQLIYWFN